MIGRLKRAMTEPIRAHIVGEDETGSRFEVQGSTLKNYFVEINKEKKPSCTCMDYQNRNRMCKHIIYCLIDHFQLATFQLEELENCNAEWGLSTVNKCHTYSGDACPVCFETVSSSQWVCKTCNNNFHFSCISDWFTILRRQKLPLTCPMCRSS